MSPILLALALCGQSPPANTVTMPDGSVYQVTYTLVRPVGYVPPPPGLSQSQPQQPAKSTPVAMAPAKSTPQAIAPQLVQYVQPAAQAVQYVPPPSGVIQPIALTLAQPVAAVTLKQPCHLDRAISAVGLRLYQRGLPRLAIVPGAATLQAAPASAYVLQPAAQPVTYQALATAQH